VVIASTSPGSLLFGKRSPSSSTTVTLKNVATGITHNAQTDEDGNYQFNNVKIGVYHITAEAPGFAKAVAESIQVTVNARQRVDLTLRAGAVSETVIITDTAPLLETESSDRGQVINREQIVNLPFPATKKLILASDGSLSNRALVAPDRNNWAPRLGLAYNLTPRTVLRGGYGISYVHFNRLGGENILAFNLPHALDVIIDQVVSSPLCAGENFLGCFRPTQAGYPNGLLSPERLSTLTTRPNFTPRETRTAYVQSWHLTVQRELVKGLLLDVAYVGNHSVKLIALGDYNQARTVTAEEIRLSQLPANDPNRRALPSIQARRPLSGFGFIQASFNGGFANYHALQVKLEQRFSGGLYLLNSFTWSKAIDNVAGHLEVQQGDNSRLNIRNIGNDRGPSNYNQPLNNTTSVVYDPPFGKGRKLASGSTALDYLIGGWRATLINTMTSGLPVNLTYSAVSGFSVGGTATTRPNLTGQPLRSPGVDPNNYLNINAVAIPSGDVLFGNAGRNIVRGPNFLQADLGLHKSFPVWRERTKLEFRMEAFNLFNRTNFQAPDGNASTIRIVNGAPAPGGSYGTIRSTFPARQIQFALKLYF
jgi:hypothetical protein